MKKILECYNLTKKIGKKYIVKDVSFNINEGEILGFIGPNGAGKTTIIKMILGLSKITMGNVYINNNDIKKKYKEAISRVGAIIEEPDMYLYLTGYQNLKLIANLYNLKETDINKVVNLVKLEKNIHNKVNTYSLGMRQRLGIAQALLHNPDLLILDEPTNGLDPIGIKELRDLLITLATKEHKAILISSHILNELETFCTKICLLKKGTLIYSNELKPKNKNTYQIKMDNLNILKRLNIEAEIINEDTITINLSKSEVANLIKKLIFNNINIYEVKEISQALEELFIKEVNNSNVQINT